jgi:hypothetical protein
MFDSENSDTYFGDHEGCDDGTAPHVRVRFMGGPFRGLANLGPTAAFGNFV